MRKIILTTAALTLGAASTAAFADHHEPPGMESMPSAAPEVTEAVEPMPAEAAPPPATMTVMKSDPTVQAAPEPEAEYPICSADVQDGCIQPRAAGKDYGNVPLDYWPGQPASEMKDQKDELSE